MNDSVLPEGFTVMLQAPLARAKEIAHRLEREAIYARILTPEGCKTSS